MRRGCRSIWSHPGGDEEIREEPQFGGISIGVLSKHASSLRLPMKSPITQTAVPHPLTAEESYDVAQLVEALRYKSEVRRFDSLGRFQGPSGRRRVSAADRLLGLRVRIQPEAWMFVLCVLYSKDREVQINEMPLHAWMFVFVFLCVCVCCK